MKRRRIANITVEVRRRGDRVGVMIADYRGFSA
jgi:hypothetical protein